MVASPVVYSRTDEALFRRDLAFLHRSDAAISRIPAKKPATCPCNVANPRNSAPGPIWEQRDSHREPAEGRTALLPLADVRTLQQYADWMAALLEFNPDGRYELKSFAVDEERRNFARRSGTTSWARWCCIALR